MVKLSKLLNFCVIDIDPVEENYPWQQIKSAQGKATLSFIFFEANCYIETGMSERYAIYLSYDDGW